VLPVVAAAVVLLAIAAWWVITRRLPPADHPLTFDADAHQPPLDPAMVERERVRLAERLVDRELFEKLALLSLMAIVFAQMLPDTEAPPLEIAIGVAAMIVANTAFGEWRVRRGRARASVLRELAENVVLNLGLVLAGSLVLASLTGRQLEHALLFVVLLSLIVTLYDRYRPAYLARASVAQAA
jgi:hypothetical protein